MNEPTSDVLVARARLEPGGRHNLAWSILGHAVVGVAIVAWPRGESNTPVREVMTINLAGSPGARTEGMTQMGGSVPAPVEPSTPRPVTPPPKPTPAVNPRPAAPRRPARSDAPPSPSTPSAPEPTTGSTPTFTGARGQGFGLSGGGGGIGRVEMDVSNFCCPEYIERIVLAIQRGWDKDQGVRGASIVTLTIRRDGSLDGVAVRRPSGFYALDNAALRAIARVQQLPPLPSEFTNPSLTLNITFDYR